MVLSRRSRKVKGMVNIASVSANSTRRPTATSKLFPGSSLVAGNREEESPLWGGSMAHTLDEAELFCEGHEISSRRKDVEKTTIELLPIKLSHGF